MSTDDEKIPGDKIGNDAKDMANKAESTANEFASEAKESAKEMKEEWNRMTNSNTDNKKVLAGILAIFLGSLGIHKFVLGYQNEGIILLVASVVGYLTICLLGLGFIILSATGIIGLIEGIIYLTKTDEEFYQTYQANKKAWF
ncbi:TM2 domain-containing protein [Dokdonia sinensis]|uniref:TM2 domain-containing protein n=1 Tax=Dokdonia sinensis TaxID=2479847 RepID=A0A3M0H1A4_9FLAO|nr:TM2 domain-containing protein [Dokdonia sinensis]RMB63386.1 TM2 domain-containing protein [Dokdonia sinensis]